MEGSFVSACRFLFAAAVVLRLEERVGVSGMAGQRKAVSAATSEWERAIAGSAMSWSRALAFVFVLRQVADLHTWSLPVLFLDLRRSSVQDP